MAKIENLNSDEDTVEFIDWFEKEKFKNIKEKNNLTTRKNYNKTKKTQQKSNHGKLKNFRYFSEKDRMSKFYKQEIKNCTNEIERIRAMIRSRETKIGNLRGVILKMSRASQKNEHRLNEIQREIEV